MKKKTVTPWHWDWYLNCQKSPKFEIPFLYSSLNNLHHSLNYLQRNNVLNCLKCFLISTKISSRQCLLKNRAIKKKLLMSCYKWAQNNFFSLYFALCDSLPCFYQTVTSWMHSDLRNKLSERIQEGNVTNILTLKNKSRALKKGKHNHSMPEILKLSLEHLIFDVGQHKKWMFHPFIKHSRALKR